MSIRFSGMTVDGSDLEFLAFDALGSGYKTPNPFVDPAVERRQLQERVARAQGVKQRYEEAVLELLRSINRTATGGAVFEEIRRQGPKFDITIRPWFIGDDWEKLIKNAKASLRAFPNMADYYQPLIRRYEKEGLAEVPNAYALPVGRGTEPDQIGRAGKRQKALVRFTPANWTYNPINPDLGIGVSYAGPGSKPDEMLMHELVHALRITAGLLNSKRRVPFQKQYDDLEEFFAILIANIYRSECKRRNIRAGYDGFFWFKSADPEAFLKEGLNRLHVRQLRFQHPLLFNKLNDVNAPFNPLRGFRDAL